MAGGLGIGSLAQAITGPPKVQQIFYSDPLNKAYDAQLTLQAGNVAADAKDMASLNEAAKRAASTVKGYEAMDAATIQNIINNRVDPYTDYTNIGNFRFGLVNGVAPLMSDLGKKAESQSDFAMGLGGRSGNGSTYQANRLIDRISRNLSPLYQTALGGIGADASAVSNNRLAVNNNTLGLMDYRSNIPGRELGYLSVPLSTRNQVTNNQIGQLRNLGGGYKDNSAAFREVKSPGQLIGEGMDQVADFALDAFSSYMGGGIGKGMGGMGGGGAGGAGAGGGAVAPRQPMNFGPSGYGGYTASYSPQTSGMNFGPSGYGGYSMGYQSPGAWQPPWKG